jgi:uncharacterized Zn finger protein
MAQFSKTWWGKRFIDALESFTDSARLGRGRSYARNGKIKSYEIKDGVITAKVRGSVNPYFGVYKEPTYNTKIEIKAISRQDWSKAIAYLGSKASLIAKLLMNEVPDNIDEAFSELNLQLLPRDRRDFKTICSCPDSSNPCKHIAGVYYLVASELDRDPFLLFELRGISRTTLQQELAKSPLGKLLSASFDESEFVAQAVPSYFTQPKTGATPAVGELKDFWLGEKRVPQSLEPITQAIVPALLVKKGGDFPAFWTQDSSFLSIMEEFYERIRAKFTIN